MYIDKIILADSSSPGYNRAIVTKTRKGYIVKTITGSGSSLYISSVYNNRVALVTDYTHARGYSYNTAIKHAKKLIQGVYHEQKY